MKRRSDGEERRMAVTEPATELDARYSDEHATATQWEHAREPLEAAPLYWV
jgi:hypothetical protein